MKIATESPLINKKLIATNPLGKITVIAEAYHKFDPISDAPAKTRYHTFIMPSIVTSDLVKVYTKPVIKALANHNHNSLVNGSNLSWQNSKADWPNWSSLRHAINEECNYLASQHKNHGYFNIFVFGRKDTSVSTDYIDTNWYQVLTQRDDGQTKVLPRNRWINLSAIYHKRWNHIRGQKLDYLASQVAHASDTTTASDLANQHRQQINAPMYIAKYHSTTSESELPDLIVGTGSEVAKRLATDLELDDNELQADIDEHSLESPQTAKHAKQLNQTMNDFNLILANPDQFYKFNFKKNRLALASPGEIATIIKHCKNN